MRLMNATRTRYVWQRPSWQSRSHSLLLPQTSFCPRRSSDVEAASAEMIAMVNFIVLDCGQPQNRTPDGALFLLEASVRSVSFARIC